MGWGPGANASADRISSPDRAPSSRALEPYQISPVRAEVERLWKATINATYWQPCTVADSVFERVV